MKPHRRLTAKRIAEACRCKREQWLSDDDGSRGSWRLVCRVSPASSARLYVRLSALQDAKKPCIPLGLYSRISKPGYLTLAQAHAKALVVIASLPPAGAAPRTLIPQDSGATSPRADRSKPWAGSREGAPDTVVERVDKSQLASLMDVCDAYVAHLNKGKKESATDVSQRFRLYVSPSSLANEPAHAIPPEAFLEFIKAIIREFENNPINRKGQRRGLLTPEKVRQYLSCAYQYVIDSKRDAQFCGDSARFALVTRNLVAEGVKPLVGVRKPRKRNLSSAELGVVWRRIRHDERLVATVVRLTMLLAGQRLKQLLRVQVSQVNIEAKTILLLDGKGGRQEPRLHLLPLPPLALAEVSHLLEISKSCASKFLIPGAASDSHIASNTVSRYVTRLSRTLVAESKADNRSKVDVVSEPFQFADLRRTMESRLGELDVHKDFRSQVLSHGLTGVQDKHYDMYEYLPQKLEVLQKVEDMLKALEKA